MKEGDVVLLLPPDSGKGPLLSPGSSTQLCKGRKFWRKIMAETRVWVVVKVTTEIPFRAPPRVKSICVRPLDKPGWTEKPDAPGLPISAPAVGIAYHLNSTVRNVEKG